MLSFSYTIDLPLRDTLSRIDATRTLILTLPQTIRSENKLEWEGVAIRTWATLSLAGHDVPKHYVATILSQPTRPTRGVAAIYGIRDAYEYIHTTWRASPKPVNLAALETIFGILNPERHEIFASHESALKELLEYLATESEHPVIQAAIAHIHISAQFTGQDAGIFARMAHYLYLSKYGYDVRGWATPDRSWESDTALYKRFSEVGVTGQNLNLWLAYIAQSTLADLARLADDIRESRFHIEFPPSFWELSDRQKEVLKLLSAPDASLTNKKLTKRFKISTITASRDLAKLATLGLIYPHGRGRAIYYTKI